jgi:hypothetical protein
MSDHWCFFSFRPKKQMDQPIADEAEPSKAVAVMMQALEWGYEQATAAILPGLDSAVDLAESHLKSCGGNREKAIDHLIARYVGYAGAVGFATNVGGFITMPVSVPANVAAVFRIQLRMIAAIAHLRGYPVKDEQVKTLAFFCLTGSAGANALEEFGIGLGTKLTIYVIKKVPGATLRSINKAVGVKLLTKTGEKGLINLRVRPRTS